jgi:hypothetical protein
MNRFSSLTVGATDPPVRTGPARCPACSGDPCHVLALSDMQLEHSSCCSGQGRFAASCFHVHAHACCASVHAGNPVLCDAPLMTLQLLERPQVHSAYGASTYAGAGVRVDVRVPADTLGGRGRGCDLGRGTRPPALAGAGAAGAAGGAHAGAREPHGHAGAAAAQRGRARPLHGCPA